MAADMENLAQLLHATLDHRQHKQGRVQPLKLLLKLLADLTS